MKYINLKIARDNKGISQEEMAIMLGYKSKSQYCMIENGQRRVPVDIALAISNILEQPVEKLFKKELNTGTDG